MKIKIKVLLFISIISLVVIDAISSIGVNNSILKTSKYLITFLTFGGCFIQVMKEIKRKGKVFYTYEIRRMIVIVTVFVVISLIKIYQTKNFTSKSFEEIMQIAIPFIYTFFIINFMNVKDISKFMKIALIIYIIAYVFSIGISRFTISNFLSISFAESYSPFESAPFAEVASALSTYFIYYRKKHPVSATISFLFCFLVFKRILLLQAVILLIVSVTNKSNMKINNGILNLSKIIFIILPISLYYLLKQENVLLFEKIFRSHPGDFTMGRVYRLWFKLNDFKSYGFGSTTDTLGYNLELDLIKIYIELGIIALIIFVCFYFDLCRGNLYSYIIVGAIFINLLFASCLTSTVGWIFRMVCIASIFYKRIDKINCLESKNKRKLYLRY